MRKRILVMVTGIQVRVGLLNSKTAAMALFPFILVNRKRKVDEVLINHERIHLMQQLEMLVIPFYLLYLFELITKGYRQVSFEKEAYGNEKNLRYLLERKWYSWLRY